MVRYFMYIDTAAIESFYSQLEDNYSVRKVQQERL